MRSILDHYSRASQLLRALLWPLFVASKLMPRRQDLAVYGSSSGQAFSDNSKYLFAARIAEGKSQHIWITRSPDVHQQLRVLGLPCELAWSLRGAWIQLRASQAYFSHRNIDLEPLFLGGAKVTALWHGIPIKRIGADADFMGKSRLRVWLWTILYRLLPHTYYMSCDEVWCPDDALLHVYQSAFRISRPRVCVREQPRVQYGGLEAYRRIPSVFQEEQTVWDDLITRHFGKRIIAWFPTHRMHTGSGLLPLLQQHHIHLSDLDAQLEGLGDILIVKPHPVDSKDFLAAVSSFRNIEVYRHPDPLPLIAVAQAVVTDYSSIILETLSDSVELAAFQFDREDYLRQVGLYYEISAVLPRIKLFTQSSAFIDWLIRLFPEATASINVK